MKASRLDSVLVLAGLLAVWQGVYMLVGADVIPSPSKTIIRAVALLQSESFWKDAANTGKAFALACAIGIVGGACIGFVLGFSQFATEVADPILGSIYSIPKITLYPIILLIFGLTLSAKVAFGVLHGIFPVIIATMAALRNVSPVHRRTARTLRLSWGATITTILAPAALPEIFVGVRIGVAVTLLGTLLAELFASSSGVGFALIRAMEIHNVVDIFALALLIFLFAAAMNGLLHALERRIRHHA
jgi:NitT/TauT family transport system permease protein